VINEKYLGGNKIMSISDLRKSAFPKLRDLRTCRKCIEIDGGKTMNLEVLV
jgi:hypothetical protein